MARPREFNLDEALENAMQAFWSYGYEATSLSDLMEAMDLHKGSIYKAFNDKHTLFLAALEHYIEIIYQLDEKNLESSKSPKKGINLWLNENLKKTCGQSLKRGCLVANVLNERAYRDEKAARLINAYLSKLSKLLTKKIKQGQELGEFRIDINPSDIAQFIAVSLVGMLSLTKGPMSKNDCLKNIKNTLLLIEK